MTDASLHVVPWYERYVRWLWATDRRFLPNWQLGPLQLHGGGAASGWLGESIVLKRGVAVRDIIAAHLPTSLVLILLALLITGVVAIPLGSRAAARPGGPADRLVGAWAHASRGLPIFLVIPLIAVATRVLHLHGVWAIWNGYRSNFPDSAPSNGVAALALPALLLALWLVGPAGRMVYIAVDSAWQERPVRTAHGPGRGQRRLMRAVIPHVLTAIQPALRYKIPSLAGTLILLEFVCGIPGFGNLYVRALAARDLPVIMGGLLTFTILSLVGRLVGDLLAAGFNRDYRVARVRPYLAPPAGGYPALDAPIPPLTIRRY